MLQSFPGLAMDEDAFQKVATLSRRSISGKCIDTSQWPTPDEGALDAKNQALYISRKQAVSLYLSGTPVTTIKQRTSISAKQAYRLIRERCLEIHPDGLPYGWRGLLPYFRIRPYKRRTKITINEYGLGAVDAMQTLLDHHPDLRRAFDSRILASTSDKRLVETKRSRKRHCVWFLDQLRRLGYEVRQEWPFNTASHGYYSVCRYIDNVLNENPTALAKSVGGPDLVKKLKTGDGTNRPVSRFMQRVEMDAHKLDGRFCVSIPLVGGGFEEKIIHRLWVIVLLEVTSRAVIGYYLSMRREVSKDDVLRAIKCALSPWKKKQVSFCDAPYLDNAGLLSGIGNEFVGLCWDETSVDGALAETCGPVKNALRDAVGSSLLEPNNSFSIRRSKDDRPFIEAYFRNLAGKGFQRLSNSTGAKPQDRKGREPESVALTSRFQYEYAEELLDVMIANYNASPHRGIGNRSPLAYAKFLHEHSKPDLRKADPSVIESLFSHRKRCVVRGGAKMGRAPYVEFFYARYTNEVLQSRQDLVGAQIWVICHKEDDCRVALATTLSGQSLGILRAAPPWHSSPHSLSVRTAIQQASSRKQFTIQPGSDAVEAFTDYVESHAGKKLPVHPAYLEARRILSAAAEESIGKSLLESAKLRASTTESPAESASLDHKTSRSSSAKTSPQAPNSSAMNLPPRRMTATR
jgi:hypothetical protein